ncbi:MAG: type II toxin-antitoxin system RelE/ParE family toxin [Candidatus Cybelea sp.]
MAWEVEFTDQFGKWWDRLDADGQEDIRASVKLLQAVGPTLGRPHADTVDGSRHANMKELRTQSNGRPLRTFFAFDPRRTAILLIAGDKTGDNRFYQTMIPIADKLYDEHLEELTKEITHGTQVR